jgi:CheY-like chemotaxis protein
MNLCLNARDAMPDGGKITIETENLLINGGYAETHPWAKPGRYVLLRIADTGVGMGADVRDRVFEPFFTTKPEGKGSGLGLSVAYGIVQRHGGMLQLYSEPGQGTTIKLYLPVTQRLASVVGSRVDPVAPKGRQETILLADDEPLVRAVMIRALERAGYVVIAASSGSEAIKLCREHDTIDLALLDVIMPDFTGPEVYARISEFRPGLPILFASGHSDASREAHRIPEHATLLSKPFAIEELLAQIRAHLDRGN